MFGAADGGAEVRLRLTNRGDTPASAVRVDADLLGQHRVAAVDAAIPPGGMLPVSLRFALDDASAGVHAAALHLEYQSPRTPGAAARTLLQPAYVLVALGENAPPAVRIDAPPARMDSVGRWRIGLESLDGAAHRVRLRAVLPRNLRAAPADVAVDVPAEGRAEQELLLFRGEAPWSSEQGAVLLAETEVEGLARASAATAVVRVGPDPALLPRLRGPLVAVMLLLLVAAAYFELRRWRRVA